MALGIGILGTGRIVDTGYIPAIANVPDARPVAVLSRDQARGEAFAAEHGIAHAYSDLDALLADPEVEAVVVATPDGMHESQVIAAARAGKHILCEKPMSLDGESCLRMAEAVQAAGVVFAMGYDHRFLAGQQAIKKMIDDGEVGPVRYVRSYVTTAVADPTNWRGTGEQSRFWAMSATGTHLIDTYRWYFGEPASVGGGMAAPMHGSSRDEISIVVLDYPGRLIAELACAAGLPGSSRMEIHGETGSIVGEGVFGRGHREARITCNGRETVVAQTDPFVGEVVELVEAIREGREPWITIEDGIRNVEIMDVLARGQLQHPV